MPHAESGGSLLFAFSLIKDAALPTNLYCFAPLHFYVVSPINSFPSPPVLMRGHFLNYPPTLPFSSSTQGVAFWLFPCSLRLAPGSIPVIWLRAIIFSSSSVTVSSMNRFATSAVQMEILMSLLSVRFSFGCIVRLCPRSTFYLGSISTES